MAFIIEALWWKREMIMKWWVGWFAANIWMTVLIFTSFYLFPSNSQNLPPSRWRYRWIIHESQPCIVWYFIIYVKFWWKVKWRWYRQIPWKETKVSCSCWSECIFLGIVPHTLRWNWKHPVHAEKHVIWLCDLSGPHIAWKMAVWNQESGWISHITANGKKLLNTGFYVVAS